MGKKRKPAPQQLDLRIDETAYAAEAQAAQAMSDALDKLEAQEPTVTEDKMSAILQTPSAELTPDQAALFMHGIAQAFGGKKAV